MNTNVQFDFVEIMLLIITSFGALWVWKGIGNLGDLTDRGEKILHQSFQSVINSLSGWRKAYLWLCLFGGSLLMLGGMVLLALYGYDKHYPH